MRIFKQSEICGGQVTVDELIKIYGSRKEIARVLGIHVSSVYQWGNRVPPLRVYQFKEMLRKKA